MDGKEMWNAAVADMQKGDVEATLAEARLSIAQQQIFYDEQASLRRSGQPDVLDRTWEAPARTQPRLKKLVFRERPIARYTADEYCRPTARPSLWQIFRAALVRVR